MGEVEQKKLVTLLADGEFHSGEELGQSLGISRAAVWKRLQNLAQWDVAVEKVRGKGYRIPGGVALLDRREIEAYLGSESRQRLLRIQVMDDVPSTNGYLQGHALGSGDVCVAERQSAGRGRRGRRWFSPYGRNLYCSVAWQYQQGVGALEGLSLAIGVLVIDALTAMGISDVQLKWPNDLLSGGRKLGGILLEVGGDVSGECQVVAGIGLNVSMGSYLAESKSSQAFIDQPWIDLDAIAGNRVDRNQLCGLLLDNLLQALAAYPLQTFAHYRDRWLARNAHLGQEVTLLLAGEQVTGRMLGVDLHGALEVMTEQGPRVFSGGEISLRPVL